MYFIIFFAIFLTVAAIISVGIKMYQDEKVFQRQTKESSVLHY